MAAGDDEPLAVFDSNLISSEAGAAIWQLYRPPAVPGLDLDLGLLELLDEEEVPTAAARCYAAVCCYAAL